MAEEIECATHGWCQKAYLCQHLLGMTSGLGFNRNEPSEGDPFPDAWCDDCELIRAAHNGWNEQSETLVTISLVCSSCYEGARIRNTHTTVTLDDLAGLHWKCGSCEEWHTGPCLDIGYNSPFYWDSELQEEARQIELRPERGKMRRATFLDDDFCAIRNRDFFVRGALLLPVIGTSEYFCWGVWGSLSRQNFEALLEKVDDPDRSTLPAMFSWMSNRIPEYEETLNLKMYVHTRPPGTRPLFELEPTSHPLAREYHNGISPERVKEIVLGRFGDPG